MSLHQKVKIATWELFRFIKAVIIGGTIALLLYNFTDVGDFVSQIVFFCLVIAVFLQPYQPPRQIPRRLRH